MRIKKYKKNLVFLIPVLILITISLLDMYGAKKISSLYQHSLDRQIIWIFIGIVLFILISIIDDRLIQKYIKYIYILGTISLLLVLFIGTNINGASSWFKIGPISLQPSEIFKPFFIVFLAKTASNSNDKKIILLLKLIIFSIVPILLIFLEPDTGVTAMYAIIFIATLIESNINKKYKISFFLIVLVVSSLLISTYFIKKDLFISIFGTSIFYRIDRILNFTNNTSYQLNNALIGIGASGPFGLGLNSNKIYIPELTTDFAYALTILNFGYIVGLIVVLLYIVILFNIYKMKIKTNNKYQKILLNGAFYLMTFQIFEHILMNIGLTPITGITLPFLSYGGSSMISYFIILAFICKCDKKSIVYK